MEEDEFRFLRYNLTLSLILSTLTIGKPESLGCCTGLIIPSSSILSIYFLVSTPSRLALRKSEWLCIFLENYFILLL